MQTQIIIAIKGADLEAIDTVEELMLAQNQLRVMDNGYQERDLDTPDWIIDQLANITREITIRMRGELERKLKIAEARALGLRTRKEVKADTEDEIKKLRKQLGKADED